MLICLWFKTIQRFNVRSTFNDSTGVSPINVRSTFEVNDGSIVGALAS
jgi:hypothetical protein